MLAYAYRESNIFVKKIMLSFACFFVSNSTVAKGVSE